MTCITAGVLGSLTCKATYSVCPHPVCSETKYAYSSYGSQAIAIQTVIGASGIAVDNYRVKNIAKLGVISRFGNNWNGYGAAPISKKVIEAAANLLMELSREPFISPTARDSIQFEYEKPNGDYLEIEIFDSYAIFYSEIRNVRAEKQYELRDTSYTDIAKEVRQFYGQQL